jgi:ketosteroid isomerase-like protein
VPRALLARMQISLHPDLRPVLLCMLLAACGASNPPARPQAADTVASASSAAPPHSGVPPRSAELDQLAMRRLELAREHILVAELQGDHGGASISNVAAAFREAALAARDSGLGGEALRRSVEDYRDIMRSLAPPGGSGYLPNEAQLKGGLAEAEFWCADAPPVVHPGLDVIAAKGRALSGAYLSALTSPGFPALGSLLDWNVRYESPSIEDPPERGHVSHGRASVVAVHDEVFGAFDDRRVAPSRVWRAPNEQAIEWTFTGTQARNWMSVPAPSDVVAGRGGGPHRVAFKGLTLLSTRDDDGSVSAVRVFFDVALVKAQLGAGPRELVGLPPPTQPAGSPQALDESVPPSAGSSKNVAVVESSLDALERDNESGYLDTMTDDVEVNTLERATPAHGRAAVKAYYEAMHRAIIALDTTVMKAWGVGQFAIVEYVIGGVQSGPIMWIPAQGRKQVRFEVVDLCEIRDGKIVRIWRYDNPLEIQL